MSTLSYAPFERHFKLAFTFGTQSVSVRRGFLLKRETERGVHYAEASPLPGHSLESLESVEAALNAPFTAREELLPSLRFAFESLEAQEQERNQPFHPVQTNALIPWAEPDQLAEALAKAQQEGFTLCKLKLPRYGWETAAGVLADFPSLRFRLDANRNLDSASFARLLEIFARASLLNRIDYIEEPYLGVWEHSSLKRCPVALAADESAPDHASALRLLEAPNPPSCFVLKPTVLGGFSATDALISALRSAGKRSIVTSALETEVGRRALLSHLSESSSHEPAGLSTGFLFRENFLPDAPAFPALPEISKAEHSYLRKLPWRVCP